MFTAPSNLKILRLGALHMPPRCIDVVWTRLEGSRRLPWWCTRFTSQMMYFGAVGQSMRTIDSHGAMRMGMLDAPLAQRAQCKSPPPRDASERLAGGGFFALGRTGTRSRVAHRL